FTKGNPHMRLLLVPSHEDFLKLKPTLWGIRQPGDNGNWEDYEETDQTQSWWWRPRSKFGCEYVKSSDGYYDRTLAAHQRQFGVMPARYGLALTQQIVDKVPLSETDVELDGVLQAD
ncbi:hypothetical protein TELCIR_20938, partial [Teladorsagia circumcincta]